MITIVTGHPRSGTSMTMMMLDKGGIKADCEPTLNDKLNPYGSFEKNQETFSVTDGQCVKCLMPQQLFDLPVGEYKVIMPVRDPEQIIFSRIETFKAKKLPPNMELQQKQIEKTYRFIRFIVNARTDMELIEIPYDDYFQKTEEVAERIADFVGREKFDPALAKTVVDQECYEVRTKESVIANIQSGAKK